jgi:hypothetical protein
MWFPGSKMEAARMHLRMDFYGGTFEQEGRAGYKQMGFEKLEPR